MAEFKSFESGIELSGVSILALVEGMGPFKERGFQILAENEIEDIVPNGWYSQQAWFDAFKTIYENIGPVTLSQVAKALSNKTPMPDHVKTLEDAFLMTDIVYHMTHRKNGQSMYDEKTGEMTEGIGHYFVEKTGERSISVVCHNPYPCIFDLAAGEALAYRYKPEDSVLIKVVHDDEKECRKKGGESCTHYYFW